MARQDNLAYGRENKIYWSPFLGNWQLNSSESNEQPCPHSLTSLHMPQARLTSKLTEESL